MAISREKGLMGGEGWQNCLCHGKIGSFFEFCENKIAKASVQLLFIDFSTFDDLGKLGEILESARELMCQAASIFLLFNPAGEFIELEKAMKIFGSQNLFSCISCACKFAKYQTTMRHFRIYRFARNRERQLRNALYEPRSVNAYRDAREFSLIALNAPGGERLLRLVPLRENRAEKLKLLERAGRLIWQDDKAFYIDLYDDFPWMETGDFWILAGEGEGACWSEIYEKIILLASNVEELAVYYGRQPGYFAEMAEKLNRHWICASDSEAQIAKSAKLLKEEKFPVLKFKGAEVPKIESMAQTCEKARMIDMELVLNCEEINAIHERWKTAIDQLLSRLNSIMKQDWREETLPLRPVTPWPEEAAALHSTLGKAYRVKMPLSKTNPLLARLNSLTGNRFGKIEKLPQKPENAWPKEAEELFWQLKELQKERQREVDNLLAQKAKEIILLHKPVFDCLKDRSCAPFKVVEI